METTPVNYTFRLIGRTTRFTAVYEYLAAGFIPAVYGVTDCGKYSTQPRIEDIIKL